MKYPPFLTPERADEAPAATAEIFEFPRSVILHAELREARRQSERLEKQVADNDIRSPNRDEQIRAACAIPMLEFWNKNLAEAEKAVAMLDADDTLTFRGHMYRAHRSINGAN